ncbi:hypothetical protein QJS66_09705 [Kocuria rhizophila]|nr:hypothetical protein QJS66_09705 [Kocuria rhizophila]
MSTAVRVASLVARLEAPHAVQDELDRLASCRLFATAPLTFRVASLSLITRGMQRLRDPAAEPQGADGGVGRAWPRRPELLPTGDPHRAEAKRLRVIVRPCSARSPSSSAAGGGAPGAGRRRGAAGGRRAAATADQRAAAGGRGFCRSGPARLPGRSPDHDEALLTWQSRSGLRAVQKVRGFEPWYRATAHWFSSQLLSRWTTFLRPVPHGAVWTSGHYCARRARVPPWRPGATPPRRLRDGAAVRRRERRASSLGAGGGRRREVGTTSRRARRKRPCEPCRDLPVRLRGPGGRRGGGAGATAR